MIKTKHFIALFVPAILIVGLAMYVQIIRYRVSTTKPSTTTEDTTVADLVPILPDDPVIGNKKAPNTIIAFEDFGCPSCKQHTAILDQLLATYPDKVNIIWKSLSVTRFPYSTTLVHAYGYCANKQGKFDAFKASAFANSDNLSAEIVPLVAEQAELDKDVLSTCLESGLPELYAEQTESIATALNIQAVPTFFVDNTQVDPPLFLEGWVTLLGIQ